MGEAGAYPNASGSIVRWFPIAERGRAQGLVWGASRLGGALTPLIVVPLVKTVGWQSCFWLFGAIGVVWAAVWAWWYRDHPQEHQAVTPGELAEIGTLRADTSHSGVPWGKLFASPQLWLIVAMYWFYVFGFIFFMFWLPKYLTVGRGMSDAAMAIVVALMFTGGAAGNVLGGYGSDYLTKRFGLPLGRKGIGATALALSGILMAAAAVSPNKWLTAVLIVLCFSITDAMLPCAWAICLDVGRRYSGSVTGAMNSGGQAAGAISTALYGYLIEWNDGNYDLPLLFLTPSLLVSAVLFAMIDPTRPLVPEPIVVESAKTPACV
jgi:sugar phosphate permease